MDTKSIIYTLYEIFSKGVTNQPFTWKPNENSDRLVENFLKRWEKRSVHRRSIGVVFLYDYFCDSYNLQTSSGRELRLVPLVQIIGEPQLKRWDNRYEDYQYSYREGFLTHATIPGLSIIKKQLNEDKDVRGPEIFEEYERQRFHNTPEGFINCLLSTSLCSENSKWCRSCSMQDDCIDELKIRDKRTALKRGYIKL